MPTEFEAFIEALSEKLRHPLPGEKAQDMMMPVGRSSEVRQQMEKQRIKYKLGGVMILLFPFENKISFPLMLRPDYPGPHARQISLPGGRKEQIDDDLISTALRETEEEIGVEQGKIQVLGTLTPLFIPPSGYKITPTVGYIDHKPTFKLDTREVEELILADLAHLTDNNYRKKKDLKVREAYILDTPYFDIHGQVVWGATGMILSEFAHIVEELV